MFATPDLFMRRGDRPVHACFGQAAKVYREPAGRQGYGDRTAAIHRGVQEASGARPRYEGSSRFRRSRRSARFIRTRSAPGSAFIRSHGACAARSTFVPSAKRSAGRDVPQAIRARGSLSQRGCRLDRLRGSDPPCSACGVRWSGERARCSHQPGRYLLRASLIPVSSRVRRRYATLYPFDPEDAELYDKESLI